MSGIDQSYYQSYLTGILEAVELHDEYDSIHQCQCDFLDNISNHADELLTLADQKLHIFPFKEVQSCWFRLYTDASIVQAVKLIRSELPNSNPGWIQEVTRVLDMALIMAGGLGREDLIHDIFRHLDSIRNFDRECARPSTNRRKLNPDQCALPSDEYSIPKLKHPVARRSLPSLESFQLHMHTGRTPIVFINILSHWPALDRWRDINYWLNITLGGRRLVPVEIGRSYVDEDWGQKLMPFREFMDTHILSQPDAGQKTGYLAQHDLLSQIPSLRNDIATPDYCYLDAPGPEPGTPVALKAASQGKTSHPSFLPADATTSEADDVKATIWFGPAWTISPLHHDPYHNILCQVVGKKYVRLYSPHYSSQLFPRSSREPAPHTQVTASHDPAANTRDPEEGQESPTIDMSNTSKIDISAIETSPHEDWDDVYPGFSDIPYVECILSPGDALYIPIGWWHYVRSCSVGISVSYWWRNDQATRNSEELQQTL
jgi:hypothetical protein